MGNDETIETVKETHAALADLEDSESTRKRPEEGCERARKSMEAAGGAPHETRSQAAGRLGALVGDELAELALANARFEIAVTKRQSAAHDADVVKFLLASHSGMPLRPIGASVSGDESSRVILVTEVSLTERTAQPGHTSLLDKVDAGMGGRAAQAVGRRLAKLVKKRQVIIVTHLAQVAAHVTTQAVVVKEEGELGAKINTTIVVSSERLGGLAWMLSGNDTEAARTHATELLGDGPGVAW